MKLRQLLKLKPYLIKLSCLSEELDCLESFAESSNMLRVGILM